MKARNHFALRGSWLPIATGICTSLFAQWPMYHGNAQRTGYTTVIGPASPRLKWSVDLKGPVITSPIVAPDGAIIVGTTLEDTLHPQYVITAINPDGTIRWRFYSPFVDHASSTASTPAVGPNGVVYAGTHDGGFCAINGDGSLLWRFDAQTAVVQTPVVAPDGSVYTGINGSLYKFSPGGSLLWQRLLGGASMPGGPTLGQDGTVYAPGATANEGSYLYAFTPSGTQKWRYTLNMFFWPLAPPTVGPDGTVFVATTGIVAINPNGTLKWYREPSYGINSYASIAVDPAGYIYYSAASYVWKLDAQGNTIWRYTLTPDGSRLGSSYSAILLDGSGSLFLGLGTGKRSAIEYEKQLLVLTPAGGLRGSFVLPEIAGTSSPALGKDGTLYIGCLDGKLYALQP